MKYPLRGWRALDCWGLSPLEGFFFLRPTFAPGIASVTARLCPW